MTVTASNFARKANDLYETEEWATEALLCVLPPFSGQVWEPAAGNHKIARVMKRHGMSVITSDICTYEKQHSSGEIDFFSPSAGEEWLGWQETSESAIITNPPYGKGNRDAVKFAELSLARCQGWVALLLTAKFDSAKTRRHLFADNPRFWGKVVLLDRISWEGNGKTGTEDHAWFIWCPNAAPLKIKPRLFYEGKEVVGKL